MDVLHALLWLVVIVVAIAIIGWALNQAPIPPPFRWVVNAAIAVLALILLFEFVVPWMGLSPPTSHRLR